MAGLRAQLGEVRRAAGYAPLLRGAPATGYVGWVGNGNAGDEAMYEAHRLVLGDQRLVPLPNIGDTLALRRLGRAGRLARVCLGGGTLVGNGHFRRTLEPVLAAAPHAPAFVLGVGVEDPAFAEGRRRDVHAELAAWVPLLRRFDVVRVRGPLSRAALAELGVEAEVSGDPALLLEPLPVPAGTAGTIGINVGTTDELWGGDEQGLLRRVGDLARELVARGWTVRLVATTTQDEPVLARLAAEHGLQHTPTGDLDSVRRALAGCQIVVAEKLHALVLAAVEHVPGIALEYRPKCRDFQASVGREPYVVSTADLDVALVLDMVEQVAADHAGERARLGEQVAARRASLLAAAVDGR